MRCIRAASLAAIFGPALLAITVLAAEAQNPYTRAEDIQEGRRFFELDCASCHGGDARGGRGPDLTRGTFRHATDDGHERGRQPPPWPAYNLHSFVIGFGTI